MGGGFSGYFTVDYAIDVKACAVETYAANHPETDVRQHDIRNVTGRFHDFDGIAGVIGGPPCQAYSKLNHRRNSGDPRLYLTAEFMRLVEEIRPRFFVLENVPTAPTALKFDVQRTAEHLGYKVTQLHVDASNFGAAQTRKRWIVIGLKSGKFALNECFPKTVRQAFTGISRNWGLMKSNDETLQKLATATDQWTAKSPGDFKNMIKLSWDSPSPAVVNLKKVYMVHPAENRNISLAEAAALQGFPPSYSWHGTESEISQMIANAMPVELARAIARGLIAN